MKDFDGGHKFRPGTKALEMIIGEESRAKISSIGRKDSLLYECYLKSFEVLRENIVHAEKFHEHRIRRGLDNYYTNVIVFDGARGRGKTSAMLTFGKTLTDLNRLTSVTGEWDRARIMGEIFDNPSDELNSVVKSLGNPNFIVLPPVDPTVLNGDHDLLGTLVARLYQTAQDWWESEYENRPSGVRDMPPSASSYAIKDAFLSDINECYLAISAIKGKNGGGAWSMSQLGKMGSASELTSHFQKAVCSLLELHGMNPQHSFVVLQIDDADMTFGNVYEILEDMRCFLKIPNLVVLMAADLTMIENLVRQAFLKKTTHSEDLVQELTEQYMIKYFPLRRQIALPNLGDTLPHSVQLVGLRAWTDEKREEYFFSELYEKGYHGVELAMSTSLLRMLYRRTGILVDDTKGYYPWLLPVSQRGIAGFVGLLHQMKRVKRLERLDEFFASPKPCRYTVSKLCFYYPCDVDDSLEDYVEDLDGWLSNVRQLEYYLLRDWVLAALTLEEGSQFRRIARSSIWDRRVMTIKALEELGGGAIKHPADTSFGELQEGLNEYKKKHGPRFGYAVRVLESLFAQEYILETLHEVFSRLEVSIQEVRDNRGRYFIDFPGLKALYSGKLACGESLCPSEDFFQKPLGEGDGKFYEDLFGFTAREYTVSEPVGEPQKKVAHCIRLDAPLFNSLHSIGSGQRKNEYRLEDVGYYSLLSRVQPLQDLMLFLASNWDALRNVAKSLKERLDTPSQHNIDYDTCLKKLAVAYKEAVSNLLGTINQEVLTEENGLGDSIISFLKRDSGERAFPSQGAADTDQQQPMSAEVSEDSEDDAQPTA